MNICQQAKLYSFLHRYTISNIASNQTGAGWLVEGSNEEKKHK